MFQSVKKATKLDGADLLGFRHFFVKQLLHPGQMLLDQQGQEAFVCLLNELGALVSCHR